MEVLAGLDVDALRGLFSEAVSHQFTQTLMIFAAAAFVHGRQVRKEIKTQFGELINVLRADLDAQKNVLGKLAGRVDNIEATLKIKGELK